VSYEEVVIDRRPLAADAPVDRSAIGEDEMIRVPLMKEELVVDKRVVPKEEVVVRKEAVTEDHTVSEELRRERLDTDGLEDVNARDRAKGDVRRRDDLRDELR
jgi:uncharacterized protein (TIGR02271 family)